MGDAETKFLLDGPGEAGKTTILHAMTMAVRLEGLKRANDPKLFTANKGERTHLELDSLRTGKDPELVRETYTSMEITTFTQAIQRNVASLTRILLKSRELTGVEVTAAESELLKNLRWEDSSWISPSRAEAEIITSLWNSGLLQKISTSNKLKGIDLHAVGSLSKIGDIVKGTYPLNPQDVIQCRKETVGQQIYNLNFGVDNKKITVLDAGGQNWRRARLKKDPSYVKFKEDAQTVFVIVVPIGDFDVTDDAHDAKTDQVTRGPDRFSTSLAIIREVIASDMANFVPRRIIVCMNKFDKFKDKVLSATDSGERFSLVDYEKSKNFPWKPWSNSLTWEGSKEYALLEARRDKETEDYEERKASWCTCLVTYFNFARQFCCICCGSEMLSVDEIREIIAGEEEFEMIKTRLHKAMDPVTSYEKSRAASLDPTKEEEVAYEYFKGKVEKAVLIENLIHPKALAVDLDILCTTAIDFPSILKVLEDKVLNRWTVITNNINEFGIKVDIPGGSTPKGEVMDRTTENPLVHNAHPPAAPANPNPSPHPPAAPAPRRRASDFQLGDAYDDNSQRIL